MNADITLKDAMKSVSIQKQDLKLGSVVICLPGDDDCITSEGLKRCNLDDIVLDLCNQALVGQGTSE